MDLAFSSGWVQSWNGVFDGNGNLLLAVNERAVETELLDLGQSDLTVYTISRDERLVLSSLGYDPFTVMTGGCLLGWITVTNIGSADSTKTMLKAYFDGNGASAGNIAVPVLAPGETVTLTFEAAMPESGAYSLKVAQSASAEGVSCLFRTQDLSVEETEALSDGITTTVTALMPIAVWKPVRLQPFVWRNPSP